MGLTRFILLLRYTCYNTHLRSSHTKFRYNFDIPLLITMKSTTTKILMFLTLSIAIASASDNLEGAWIRFKLDDTALVANVIDYNENHKDKEGAKMPHQIEYANEVENDPENIEWVNLSKGKLSDSYGNNGIPFKRYASFDDVPDGRRRRAA